MDGMLGLAEDSVYYIKSIQQFIEPRGAVCARTFRIGDEDCMFVRVSVRGSHATELNLEHGEMGLLVHPGWPCPELRSSKDWAFCSLIYP